MHQDAISAVCIIAFLLHNNKRTVYRLLSGFICFFIWYMVVIFYFKKRIFFYFKKRIFLLVSSIFIMYNNIDDGFTKLLIE